MLKISRIFTDNMILQRNKPWRVWGWSSEDVYCTLTDTAGGITRAETRRSGEKFEATFPAVTDVTQVYTVTVACGQESVSFSARFGDVYLALGQSNMSYSLGAVEHGEEIAARAEKAEIAVLDLTEAPFKDISEITRPLYPQEDLALPYTWMRRGDEFMATSAIGVATATLLNEKHGIPTGVIVAAMGGLPVEAYVPRESLEADSELLSWVKAFDRYTSIENYNRMGERNWSQSSGVYNEKVAPLVGLNFSGILWYLGESSAYDFRMAQCFARELKLIVRDYAALFGNIPFIAVGIAPEYYYYGDTYGYLYVNEVLASLEDDFPQYLFVPIHDIEPRWLKENGDLYFHPIHPVNKLPVAERIAAALTDGKRYPRIASVRFEKGYACVQLTNADEALAHGKTEGFTLAGKDGKYYPAVAVTHKDSVTVRASDVSEPVALTYAFMQYQNRCNLQTTGRPVLPYRTCCEPVTENYCFPPAYTVFADNVVCENCFGWDVGTCHKIPLWKSGEIYAADNATVKVSAGEMQITAEPKNAQYFIFGVSPALCLSGHKSHLADYTYWNFELCAPGTDVEFLGVVVRASDGNVYRLATENGAEKVASLPVPHAYAHFSVNLSCGAGEDGGFITFTREQRKCFVQAEFLFRSKTSCRVCMRALTLSDKRAAKRISVQKAETRQRADIQLPE